MLPLLVDMDGVLADFESEMAKRWLRKHLTGPTYPREREVWDAWELLPESHKQSFIDIMCEEGFFHSLTPVEGALEALREMLAVGLDVRICTAPMPTSDFCMGEKVRWVRDHLGTPWVKRMIISADKTVIRGFALIDDKPVITGVCKPEWTHVIFNHCYNQNAQGPRLNAWSDWRPVLTSAFGSITGVA